MASKKSTLSPINHFQPTPLISKRPSALVTNEKKDGFSFFCKECEEQTQNATQKVIGRTALAWCACLFLTVGVYGLCLYPLITEDCKTIEHVCTKCKSVKHKIQPRCC